MLGTLPFVDNWSHLGGFVTGIFTSIIFLPYISFGKWHQRGRIAALAISLPVLLIMLTLTSFMFYKVTNTEFCPSCYKVSCMNWHPAIACKAEQTAAVFREVGDEAG